MDRLGFDLGADCGTFLLWGFEQLLDLLDCPVWAQMRREEFDRFVDYALVNDVVDLDRLEEVMARFDAVQEYLEREWDEYHSERFAQERRAEFYVVEGGKS